MPHEGEAAKLLNVPSSHVKEDRLRSVIEISIKHNALTVLKGPNTLISNGNETFCCMNGSTALSTAGTGDVLAGLIASFLAQGLKPMESCKLGVALHGHCAEQLNLISGLIHSYIGNKSFKRIKI